MVGRGATGDGNFKSAPADRIPSLGRVARLAPPRSDERMKNVVPFKAPEPFERLGIDWTREAANDRERGLREAFLTYESSCGTFPTTIFPHTGG
ncbi:MAG: hypothetical protein JWM87_2163 [Candidatus Eremiobacteraeota bacterium]|nr:hypothetical protein [Candidatus Eremiobacteraeota bacterium]